MILCGFTYTLSSCHSGIAGSNNHEVAIIDMTNDGVEDLRLKYCRLMFSGFVSMCQKAMFEKIFFFV